MVYLCIVRKCKVDALVDSNFKALVINHGPVSFVTILINCHIRMQQLNLDLLKSSGLVCNRIYNVDFKIYKK